MEWWESWYDKTCAPQSSSFRAAAHGDASLSLTVLLVGLSGQLLPEPSFVPICSGTFRYGGLFVTLIYSLCNIRNHCTTLYGVGDNFGKPFKAQNDCMGLGRGNERRE